MARAKARSALRQEIRDLSDTVGATGNVTDSWLDGRINNAVASLWDKLITADPEYHEKSATLTTTTGTKSYALATAPSPVMTDFYKILGVDLVRGDERYTVEPHRFQEKNFYLPSFVYRAGLSGPRATWRVYGLGLDGTGATIHFEPDPGTEQYELHYVQQPQLLTADTDTFEGVAGWEDWVIYRVAREVALKREEVERVQMLSAMLREENDRIQNVARARNAGRAKLPADTRGITAPRWGWR